MGSTTRGAFPFPADTENWKNWRIHLTVLADRLAVIGALWRQSTAGSRGAAGTSGTLHHSSDTDAVALDTGSTWLGLATTSDLTNYPKLVGQSNLHTRYIRVAYATDASGYSIINYGATFSSIANVHVTVENVAVGVNDVAFAQVTDLDGSSCTIFSRKPGGAAATNEPLATTYLHLTVTGVLV